MDHTLAHDMGCLKRPSIYSLRRAAEQFAKRSTRPQSWISDTRVSAGSRSDSSKLARSGDRRTVVVPIVVGAVSNSAASSTSLQIATSLPSHTFKPETTVRDSDRHVGSSRVGGDDVQQCRPDRVGVVAWRSGHGRPRVT